MVLLYDKSPHQLWWGPLSIWKEERGRKEVLGYERFRLTASVAFHDYRIIAEYDIEINCKRTNCDLEIKIFLSFLFFRFFSILRNRIRAVIQ